MTLAQTGVLLAVARADGVVDDEELLPLLVELDLPALGAEERARVVGWLVRPPEVAELLPALAPLPEAARHGLALRLVELVGTDAFLAPGELEALRAVAAALGVTEDQLGAMRAFLLDVDEVSERGHDPVVRARILRRAGSTLDAAGVPAEALAGCAALRGVEGTQALAEGLGLPDLDLILGDAAARAARRAGDLQRLRDGLDVVVRELRAHERALDGDERTALELRRRALERRRRDL